MQQQLSAATLLQATHQSLMHRVNSASDLQQQQQHYSYPPSPQQQQQQYSPLRVPSRSHFSPGPGSPYRCDSPASPLAEVSMADMAQQQQGAYGTSASPVPQSPQQQSQQQQPHPQHSPQQQQQHQGDDGSPQLQLRVEPERGAAGLPSSPRYYGRLGVRGSRDRERFLAPTGYL
jgi:hypothetical protein